MNQITTHALRRLSMQGFGTDECMPAPQRHTSSGSPLPPTLGLPSLVVASPAAPGSTPVSRIATITPLPSNSGCACSHTTGQEEPCQSHQGVLLQPMQA